ncbi:MAG: outer membrane beta-barrel protein [Pseudomonadota bacterium]
MKSIKILAAAAVTSGLALSSAHADGHTKPYTWSGIFIGAEGGQAFGGDAQWTFEDYKRNGSPTSDRANNCNDGDDGTEGCDPTMDLGDGALFGGFFGFQKQHGRFVLGAEISHSATDLEGTEAGVDDDVFTTSIDALTTVALKLGHVLGPQSRWLVYGKAGLAVANVETTIVDDEGDNVGTATDEKRHFGFLAGAGLEYMLTKNIVIGAEYNFMTFGSKTHEHTFIDDGDVRDTITDDVEIDSIQTIKARVGYKF